MGIQSVEKVASHQPRQTGRSVNGNRQWGNHLEKAKRKNKKEKWSTPHTIYRNEP